MTDHAHNIYRIIESHRSIRKYKDLPVPEDVLQRILAAATRASSSGNMQAYSVIVTQDPELKQKLFKPHFEQSMVLEAPALLTFCADFHRMRRWLAQNKAPPNFDNFMSFMIGAIDAILASQNAALAAEAEGLGICYMGTTLASCLEIAEILRCPEHVVPVVGFSLGYPGEDPTPRDRLPLKAIVHRETYRAYSGAEIDRVYAEKETRGWERYMSVPELKQKIEDSGVMNLAQVYTTVKYTRESHLEYSRAVLECLSAQGFFNHGGFDQTDTAETGNTGVPGG
jgi:nitroreductase